MRIYEWTVITAEAGIQILVEISATFSKKWQKNSSQEKFWDAPLGSLAKSLYLSLLYLLNYNKEAGLRTTRLLHGFYAARLFQNFLMLAIKQFYYS